MSAPRSLGQTIPQRSMMLQNASRTPPPSPKRAPPSSPIKRRRFLKESEENAGILSIERYIYRTDPYRSTSADFPFPTPLFIEDRDATITQRLLQDPLLREIIASTLGKHNIVAQGMTIAKQSKPGYPGGGDIPVTAVRIDIDVGNNSPTDAWSAARRDVELVLQERGFGDLVVELVDPKRFYQLSLFPVFPRDPLVAVYEARHDAILEIIETFLGQAWTSFSLFRVGRSSLATQHAIVVMVKPLTEHDWLVLRWNIESVVNTENPSRSKIGVEFVPGHWGDLPPTQSAEPGGEISGGKSFVDEFSAAPVMGTSIGVLGESGGGTLGGFFGLHCSGIRHYGFLTNSHVVQPASGAPKAVKAEYDWYGCHYLARKDDPRRSELRYFAVKDVLATRTDINRLLEANVRSIKIREKEIEERIALEKSTTHLHKQKDRFEADTSRLQTMMTVLDTMPRSLGKVLCASGRAVTVAKRLLDWAFVEIPEHIQQRIDPRHGNLLPQANDPGFHKNGPLAYECLEQYVAEPDMPLQGFSKVEKGEWYFKIGRTTGITTGVCNGTQSTFRLNSEAPVYVLHDRGGMVDKLVTLDQQTIRELVIVNAKHGLRSANIQETFCKPGDSGSLLVDRKGYVAGLLYGALTGLCGPHDRDQYANAGLVTDIRDVLASISARTTGRFNNGQPNGPPGELFVIN